ncbi:MAG: alpha-amylase family glycosyl hydrolase, partial [Candidatus Hodarchaeales archaeon]
MTFFPDETRTILLRKLEILYNSKALPLYKELELVLSDYNNRNAKSVEESEGNDKPEKFSKNDIILNTYSNSIQGEKGTPLEILNHFSTKYLNHIVNGCHILPFYSWDTDRGFSVLDYYTVDPRNGSWEQVSSLKDVFDILMVDCVLNHASLYNPLIQGGLLGKSEYENFVLAFDESNKPTHEERIKITRARPNPILTEYFVLDTDNQRYATFDRPLDNQFVNNGWVWTTFSRANNPDGSVATRQVDLNFQNPQVFLEIVKIMLFYISKGANWIRLDAIGYLWKKLGTNCLHLPETHIFIEILAKIFEYVEPFNTVLIGEVNEPQERALQYLGTESNQKSDMIYLFTHFPLAVHAVLT